MKRSISWILLLVVAAVSCKKDPPQPVEVDLGHSYAPVEVGRYVIYEVDSIAYDDAIHPADTTRYLLKEIIDSIFNDNAGRPTMRLERYWKIYNDTVPYSALPWLGPRVWTATRTSTALERKEENNIYIRLVFPPDKGKKWNGNSYNTLGQKDYEILSTDKPDAIGSLSFDSVVTIEQFSQINIIEFRYEMEQYARGVGLIYKQRDSIYDGGGPDTVGYTFRQKIISYGK